MTHDTTGALCIAPLPPKLFRNERGIIIDSFGDVSISHQCVTLAVAAHKGLGDDTDEEVIHLTIPLLGSARIVIEAYLAVMLPGYGLHDWAVYEKPCSCESEPF